MRKPHFKLARRYGGVAEYDAVFMQRPILTIGIRVVIIKDAMPILKLFTMDNGEHCECPGEIPLRMEQAAELINLVEAR